MQLFPKTKAEWIKTILFPFKAHLAVVCLILLLSASHRPWPEAVSGTLLMFSVLGGVIDFSVFIMMAIFLLACRRYRDSLEYFLFALAAIVILGIAPALAPVRYRG